MQMPIIVAEVGLSNGHHVQGLIWYSHSKWSTQETWANEK
jgi:hypothetical protein